MKDKVIVCRCEDITEEEVIEAIENGARTMDELKRLLRVGMGPCQGRTCGPIIKSILSRKLKKEKSDIKEWRQRPPLKPVKAKNFFPEDNDE